MLLFSNTEDYTYFTLLYILNGSWCYFPAVVSYFASAEPDIYLQVFKGFIALVACSLLPYRLGSVLQQSRRCRRSC
jgi:hypothetical protein